MSFSVENILDMISSCSEESLQSDFAVFDCPQNIDLLPDCSSGFTLAKMHVYVTK